MVKEAKDKVVATKQRTVKRVKRFEQLVEAVSLLGVAAYAVFTVYNKTNLEVTDYAVIVAAVIIGLRGAREFLKHLDAK